MTAMTVDGLLVLDKPGGMTSRAAVDRAKRWFPRRTPIGHTGTLDPLATGVLVLCLGAATRLAEYVQRMAKTYRAGILLGARSDTDDADGAIAPVEGVAPPHAAAVTARLGEFIGDVEQTPPAFSAAKVAGRRAYDLARKGGDVELAPRTVRIYSIDIIEYSYPRLDLEVRCGKGTYIRSLARDLGDRLGCGALVQTLRRTRVGPFSVDEAVTLATAPESARGRVLPPAAAVAELPRVTAADDDLHRLCQGQAISLADFGEVAAAEAAVFAPDGRLAATARLDPVRRLLRPEKVFWQGRG
jgi:tRNA pseudouridine55 synthase